MAIQIDQDGLSEGTPGKSRTDGLATGAEVTLTNTGSGATTFQLLWVPPGDTTAEATLAPTEDPKVWTFEPTPNKYGTYLIRHLESGERRTLSVRTPVRGLIIPALGERGGAMPTSSGDNNADDFDDPALNELPSAAWWRAMHELISSVDSASTLVTDYIRSFGSEVQIRGIPWPDGGNGGFLVVSPGLCALDNNDGGELRMASSSGGALTITPVGHFGMPADTTHHFTAWIDSSSETLLRLGVVDDAPAVGFYGSSPVARPSITGATTQDQVDSLVAALEALGLVTDDRP